MVLVKGAGVDYTPHTAGVFASICIDVIDMGAKATQYGLKDHVRVVFATTETILVEGVERPCIVLTTMTKTIGKDSNLRKFLEGWRGKPFTAKELEDGFDVDDLLDVPAMLNIVHKPSPDGTKTFANIATATRVPRGLALPDLDELNYVRVRNRSAKDQADYLARFRGEQIASPSQRGTGGSAKAPAPAVPKAKAQQKPVQDEFEDFPGALQDEDDDLPF
jgi:hypothetical protein